MKRPTTFSAWILFLIPLTAAADVAQTDSMGRDYFVYAPPRIDPSRTYWLVVGVHGYGGKGQGAAGLAEWAKRGDCIVVGPSFPNEGYQLLRQQADEQLEKLFADLSKQYKLHPKMFLYGFSGGAQFSHRFLMKRPDLVAGCAAHSGGSWSTGEGWGDINPKAAEVPLVISCGLNDTAKMNPTAPLSRLDWCKQFEKLIAERDFLFDSGYWPTIGHQGSPGAQKLTQDCYTLATQVMPEGEKARHAIAKAIDDAKYQLALASIARSRASAPKTSGTLVQKVARKHNAQLDELVKRIDEVGLAKVRAIPAAQGDAKALAQLRELLIEFRGAPLTLAAAQEAIKKLTATPAK